MKLICSGKILSDDVTVESCNLTATDFFVVMAKPAKAAAVSAGTASAASAPSSTPSVVPAQSQDSAAALDTAASESSAPTTPASAPSVGSEEQITQIMEMGFPREQVEAALKSAFGNGERAVEYLMHGGPASMETETPSAEPATSSSATDGAASATAPAGDMGTLSESSPLAPLLNNPMFAQLRAFVQREPHQLPALLQQLGQQQPDLVQLINSNRNDFYLLLNTPVTDDQNAAQGIIPGGQRQIQVTPAENEAIERLCAMGFDKGAVVQAYFACDKNEELAANYLLSNLD